MFCLMHSFEEQIREASRGLSMQSGIKIPRQNESNPCLGTGEFLQVLEEEKKSCSTDLRL